jgi:two-component system, cell cycle response regulator DivK
VVTADNGAAVIQVALDHLPDVVVMDLAMPQFDGITATERIKANARTRGTRVILLTGYPHYAIERGALERGVDRFLTKPCLPEDLERHVNQLRRPKVCCSGLTVDTRGDPPREMVLAPTIGL